MEEALFARSALLLGEEALEALARRSVLLFGVGGVGSFVAEGLARSGIGRITLVDNDTVAPSNCNRQLVALHSTLGQPKAQVMRDRILDINPACQAEALCLFYGPETRDAVDFSAYDYVVDAIDTMTAKLLVIQRAKAAGVPVISSMGTGNKLDPSRFRITDIAKTAVCPLARVMRRELKSRGIAGVDVLWSDEPPRTPLAAAPPAPGRRQTPGSVAFVPPVLWREAEAATLLTLLLLAAWGLRTYQVKKH